ncbi:Hypothetical protein FKW44_010873, partial [Caligus rogercresseyi]
SPVVFNPGCERFHTKKFRGFTSGDPKIFRPEVWKVLFPPLLYHFGRVRRCT